MVLLYVLELSIVSLIYGTSLSVVLWFIFYFVSHIVITGLAITTAVHKHSPAILRRLPFAVVTGVVADCLLAFLCWRFDLRGIYELYPVGALVFLILALLRTKTPPLTTQINGTEAFLSCAVMLQVAVPLIWYFSSIVTVNDRNMTDQLIGMRSLATWPPMNLAVADLPYSNNYALHLLLNSITQVTQIDSVSLLSRLSPIFLSWLFARTLHEFCLSWFRLHWMIALLPGVCFFLVVGYSPIIGHVFGTPTISAALLVQSPLLSYSIMLLLLSILATYPRKTMDRCLALASIIAVTFVGVGARAQLGPVVFCASLLLVVQAALSKKAEAAVWYSGAAVAILTSTLLALLVFLTLGSGFSGTSFLRLTINPINFVAEILPWYFAGQWLLDSGASITIAAAISFLVVIMMQPSFLLPPLLFAAYKLSARQVRSLSPMETLLVGVIIAGVAAVCLTEAPGGSQYVFLHYAKIAAIILGAAGFQLCLSTSPIQAPAAGVLSITAFLAFIHVADAARAAFDLRLIERAFRPPPPADAELAQELSRFFLDYDDLNRSVFVFDNRMATMGPYFLPVVFGLQSIGDQPILNEYSKWRSPAKAALQWRACLLRRLDQSLVSGVVDGNLILALGATLQKKYDSIYFIAQPGVNVTRLTSFRIRDGPVFSAFRIPLAHSLASEECAVKGR